ncbi:MAG: uroporphyrinogen-III synthase [Salinimicrobium sp.]
MSATVLSTKKLSPQQKSLLINAGIGVVERDFIKIAPLDFQIERLPENVIFSSKNAIKAILRKDETQLVKEKKIFCVGEKTADFLKENGFQIAATANYGADLAKLIIEKYASESFLFFCGKKRNPDLPKMLKKHAVDLTEIEVYDTLPSAKSYARNFDGVLFFSPSGVKSFCSENALSGSIAFCIGKTTASEAEKHTKRIVIANKPSIENVIVQAVKKLK